MPTLSEIEKLIPQLNPRLDKQLLKMKEIPELETFLHSVAAKTVCSWQQIPVAFSCIRADYLTKYHQNNLLMTRSAA